MRLLLLCRSPSCSRALLRDQLVDPLEIVLGGPGPVLEERPGVAIDGAARGSRRRLGEPLGELGAAALEEREAVARRRGSRQNESFSANVRSSSASSSVSSSANSARPRVGDRGTPCGCAGPGRGRRRSRAAARSPSSEPVGTKPPARPGSLGLVDLLDRAGALEAAQRRVERAERDAPQRAERLRQALLQLVAVERLLGEQSEDGELQHECSTIYRIDISIKHPRPEWSVRAG